MVLFVCLPWNTFWYTIREKIAAILKIEEVPVQPAEKNDTAGKHEHLYS